MREGIQYVISTNIGNTDLENYFFKWEIPSIWQELGKESNDETGGRRGESEMPLTEKELFAVKEVWNIETGGPSGPSSTGR